MSVLDSLHLPHEDRVVFERNTLVASICQIQFSPILDIASAATVAPFQSRIRKAYPVLQGAVRIGIEVQPEGNVQQQSGQQQWHFSDVEGVWSVVLTPTFLVLETRQYERFEEFIARLQTLLEAFCDCFQPIAGQRVGLRYVNEIRRGLDGLTGAINPALLGPLAAMEIKEWTQQSIQRIVLGLPGNQTLTIQHGYLNEGSAVQPRPNSVPPEGPFYLLDFDIALTPDSSGALALFIEPKEVCERIEEYNRLMYQLYRWCVTSEFASSLGEREHGS